MTARCRRCGHRLRTEVSRALGVGPVCFRRGRWRLRIRAPARRTATAQQLALFPKDAPMTPDPQPDDDRIVEADPDEEYDR